MGRIYAYIIGFPGWTAVVTGCYGMVTGFIKLWNSSLRVHFGLLIHTLDCVCVSMYNPTQLVLIL